MNKDILKMCGFNREVDLVNNAQCPLCEATINMADFRDDLSLKEFGISGMCQSCQDSIYDADNDIGDDWDDPLADSDPYQYGIDWDSVDEIY